MGMNAFAENRDCLVAVVFCGLFMEQVRKARIPILLKNCVVCHREDNIAPMSLMTYNDTQLWAQLDAN
jgi:hypothetical protein